MSFAIKIKASAAKALGKIREPDRSRIIDEIDHLADEPHAGSALKDEFAGLPAIVPPRNNPDAGPLQNATGQPDVPPGNRCMTRGPAPALPILNHTPAGTRRAGCSEDMRA